MSREPGQDRDDSDATTLLAFLIGMVAGAAVALLYAPAEGRAAREYVADAARRGREKAADAADQGREIWERQREHLESAVARGREAYREARDRRRGDAPGPAESPAGSSSTPTA